MAGLGFVLIRNRYNRCHKSKDSSNQGPIPMPGSLAEKHARCADLLSATDARFNHYEWNYTGCKSVSNQCRVMNKPTRNLLEARMAVSVER